MLWAVRGKGIHAYLKKGFNILRRYRRGTELDDVRDCFMWLGSAKTMQKAKQFAEKQEGEVEIREFKIQQVENDS